MKYDFSRWVILVRVCGLSFIGLRSGLLLKLLRFGRRAKNGSVGCGARGYSSPTARHNVAIHNADQQDVFPSNVEHGLNFGLPSQRSGGDPSD